MSTALPLKSPVAEPEGASAWTARAVAEEVPRLKGRLMLLVLLSSVLLPLAIPNEFFGGVGKILGLTILLEPIELYQPVSLEWATTSHTAVRRRARGRAPRR